MYRYTVNLFEGHNVPEEYVRPSSMYFGEQVEGAVACVHLDYASNYHGANPVLAPDDIPEELLGLRAVKIGGTWYKAGG